MFQWRGVDALGDRFGDLAEVRDATGDSGAFTYDPETEAGAYVSVEPVGTPVTWGVDSGATAYVDRGRVWLDGFVNPTGGSGAIGTLPAGKRPASTVYLGCIFANDVGGTASWEVGLLSAATDGTVTLSATVTLTGTLSVQLTGLSFPVAP